jgi:hypothetical protein
VSVASQSKCHTISPCENPALHVLGATKCFQPLPMLLVEVFARSKRRVYKSMTGSWSLASKSKLTAGYYMFRESTKSGHNGCRGFAYKYLLRRPSLLLSSITPHLSFSKICARHDSCSFCLSFEKRITLRCDVAFSASGAPQHLSYGFAIEIRTSCLVGKSTRKPIVHMLYVQNQKGGCPSMYKIAGSEFDV